MSVESGAASEDTPASDGVLALSDTQDKGHGEQGSSDSQELVTSFQDKYRRTDIPTIPLSERLKGKCELLTQRKWWSKAVQRNFPFLRILRGYKLREDLPNDLVSGFTVGIMQIPQSMAYAMLASLPPICGLYTSLFAPIVYFFIGSSRHISMGVIAIVSLMIGTVLDREIGADDLDPPWQNSTSVNVTGTDNVFSPTDLKKIQLATALSLVSGLFMVLFGKLGLGVVTSYMSEPLVSGFTTGAATQVITSQIKHVFGVKVPRYNGVFKVIKTWIAFFQRIPSTNLAAVIVSVICMLVLYLVKIQVNQRFKSKLKIPIPVELVVVILGTVASHFGEFHDNYNLSIVEDIPAGMPMPQVPDLRLARNCIFDAIIIGIVAFAQSVSMAKIFAKKNGYKIDSNQEMVGYGAGSIVSSFFSGYITAASVARSSVQESAGGKTQIAGLFSCVVVFVVVMAVGPLFYNLPTCVLAAVIIVSLRSLFLQVFDLVTLWKVSKFDWAIWLVTFTGVVVLDADYGLGIGILFSLLTVVVRTQRTKTSEVGEVDSTEVFQSSDYYKEVNSTKGVVILTYNSPLYFANADKFVKSVNKSLNIDPQKVKKKRNAHKDELKKTSGLEMGVTVHSSVNNCEMKEPLDGDKLHLYNSIHGVNNIHHIIIDCSGINFIDTMGVKAFKEVIVDYLSIDIEVLLAQCKDDIVGVLKATDFWETYKDRVFLTIKGAVDAVSITAL